MKKGYEKMQLSQKSELMFEKQILLSCCRGIYVTITDVGYREYKLNLIHGFSFKFYFRNKEYKK
jgi:hypothetical protein